MTLTCNSDIAFHHKTLGSHSLLHLNYEALIHHIHQQCIQYENRLYISFKNSHLSPASHHQAVSNTKQYKHRYVNLGSTAPPSV